MIFPRTPRLVSMLSMGERLFKPTPSMSVVAKVYCMLVLTAFQSPLPVFDFHDGHLDGRLLSFRRLIRLI